MSNPPQIKEMSQLSAPSARYQLVRELGRGGMGVVYLAHDTVHNRQVALKLLPPHAGPEQEGTERFRREARELAKLSHPNIVALLDSGEGDDRDFLVMEYIDGGNLRDLMGRMALPSLLELFVQIFDGLEYIHQSGIVHRDLKPDNILLTATQCPKISDFGLARRMERDPNSKLTQAGSILGTCGYVPPEQILSSQVGPEADLYSLGVVLFEAVTGRLPFVEDVEFRMMQAHLRSIPPLPSSLRPGIPPRLDSLLLKLLEKKPRSRPATALEVKAELLAIVEELPPTAAPIASDSAAREPGRQFAVEKLLPWLCDGLGDAGCAGLVTARAGTGRTRRFAQLVPLLHHRGHRVILLEPATPGDCLTYLFKELGRNETELRQLYLLGGAAAVAGSVRRLLSARAPLCCLIDDFERHDSLTQRVVIQLYQLRPPPGVAWLASVLSSHPFDFPEKTTVMEAPPWEETQLAELARNWMGGRLGGQLSPALSDYLTHNAQGSPRMLRLWLTALGATGKMERREGRWDLVGAPTGELVDGLHTLLEQREGALAMCRVAASLTQPFQSSLLEEHCEQSAGHVAQVLAELEQAGLLEASGTPPSSFLRFSHAPLLDRLRSTNTQMLEGQPALEKLLQQAQCYQDDGYHREAAELWGQAQGMATGRDKVLAQSQLHQCLAVSGRHQDALVNLKSLMDENKSTDFRTEIAYRLAQVQNLGDDRKGAIHTLQDELATLPDATTPQRFRLSVLLGELFHADSRHEEALQTLREALRQAQNPNQHDLARLEIALGQILLNTGRYAEAQQVLESCLGLVTELACLFQVTRCLELLGDACLAVNQPAGALGFYDRALDACGGSYPADYEARLWIRLSRTYEATNDVSSACMGQAQAVRLLRLAIDPSLPEALLRLGRLQQASGAEEKAERTLRESLDVSIESQNHRLTSTARRELSLLLLTLDRPEEADVLAETLLTEGVDGRVEALCLHSKCLLAMGRGRRALETAETATTEARQQAPALLAEALACLAEASLKQQLFDAASRHLVEIKALNVSDGDLESRCRAVAEALIQIQLAPKPSSGSGPVNSLTSTGTPVVLTLRGRRKEGRQRAYWAALLICLVILGVIALAGTAIR